MCACNPDLVPSSGKDQRPSGKAQMASAALVLYRAGRDWYAQLLPAGRIVYQEYRVDIDLSTQTGTADFSCRPAGGSQALRNPSCTEQPSSAAERRAALQQQSVSTMQLRPCSTMHIQSLGPCLRLA